MISLKVVVHAEALDQIFSLPLSEEASWELLELQEELELIAYDADAADKWLFIWGRERPMKQTNFINGSSVP